jgi:plastocyanin
MDNVNSRKLTSQDGFLQLFASADEFTYHLTSAPEDIRTSHESSFHLTVKPGTKKRGAGTQFDVKVHWDVDGRRYVPTPDNLAISVNDYVLWHCERMEGSPPFAVRGQGRSGSFSSSSLGSNAAFTHFFLTPGEVKYQVSGKGTYLIQVTDHRKVEKPEYAKRTADAPVVTIRRGAVTPTKLDIVAGQTVIWVVEEGADVSITSVR